MTIAPSSVGIDVSKTWLDTFDATASKTLRIANGFIAIVEFLAALPPGSTIVFEATAPHDTALRKALSSTTHRAVRVNPARARDFARAAGYLAKTDKIDARMLAAMAIMLASKSEPAFNPEREELASFHRHTHHRLDESDV